MKQTLTIPETFLGVGYTKERAGLPLEAVRVPVPQTGADQVLIRVAASSLNPLEYKRDDIAAEIARLTGGRGVDLVFDVTYSEPGFVETAKTVRQGGSWLVLGVGPGKTTRIVQTESPVDSILAARRAKHINVNILRYFSEPATLACSRKNWFSCSKDLEHAHHIKLIERRGCQYNDSPADLR